MNTLKGPKVSYLLKYARVKKKYKAFTLDDFFRLKDDKDIPSAPYFTELDVIANKTTLYLH